MTKAHRLRGTVAASVAACDYKELLKQRANSEYSDIVVGMLKINSTLQSSNQAKCKSNATEQVSTMLFLPLLDSFNLMDAISLPTSTSTHVTYERNNNHGTQGSDQGRGHAGGSSRSNRSNPRRSTDRE